MEISLTVIIAIIVGAFGFTTILTPIIYWVKAKKGSVENSPEFEKMVEHFKNCQKMSEYQRRATTVILLAYVGLMLVYIATVALIFAPIFRIKAELLGEELGSQSFSIYDEMKLFFANYSVIETMPSDIGPSYMLMILFVFVLCLMPVMFYILDMLYGQYRNSGKIRGAVLFSYFGIKAKRENALRFIFLIRHMLMAMLYVLLALFVGAGYYFVVRGSVISASYMPFLNSVSYIWLVLVVILFLGCIVFYIFARNKGKALIRDLEAECYATRNDVTLY